MFYMVKSSTFKGLIGLIFIILLSNFAFAGWVITEESTDSYGNKQIQTTFIQDNFIRHETLSSIAIIDLEKKIITIVFSEYRVYWSGTTQELKMNSIAAYDKQMEEMLIGLPPDAKKELDSIYTDIKRQMLDTTYQELKNIKVIETLEKEEILGYNAVKYNIEVDSNVVESVWHTTDIKPYGDIDIDYMISFMKQLNPISGQGSISQTEEYLNLLRSGMLLKSIEYYSSTKQQEVRVSNIREIDIIPEFFKPPENYRESSFSDILYLMPIIEEEKNEDNW